ncbi:MAG: SUMF1/EgtB/PvdO family nonheme iron enzyme [Rhodothermaceae bacterium]|nr:SUMF1/EgtB/PvdO family nonheme iron enzyme [Rhodothermaceae bacterium]
MRPIAALLLLALVAPASASGLRVTEVTLVTEGDRAFIEATMRWERSWRGAESGDAAWVFAKVRSGQGGWDHARLLPYGHRLLHNHTDGPGPLFTVSDDSLGAFVLRDALAPAGPNHWRVRFALADSLGADVQARVFGLEMVYVPSGPFWLGDPEASETLPSGPDGRWDLFGAFYTVGEDGATADGAYRVSSADAIPVCDGPGSLCYTDSEYDGEGDNAGPIPAAFPNGFGSFYLMKYELTQGQYADFLNTLDRQQTANRAIHGARNYYRRGRGTIALVGDVYVAAHPDRACNYLSWDDAAAYTDWAALRPMTELEYEKAARGPLPPVSGEYAWGTTTILHGDSLFVGDEIAEAEDGRETIGGNANYLPNGVDWQRGYGAHLSGGDGGFGPLRAGIFEAAADGNRERAGAGYYGAMELSGSLFDRVVSAAHPTGRAFTGSHGDGRISYAGRATNSDWPGMDAEGLGLRGGSFAFNPRSLTVARRSFGAYASFYREVAMGYRAARTAP